MKAAEVSDLLGRYRIMGLTEVTVQEQIESVLQRQGIPFQREVELTPGDRIDFMVGAVGVEVKTKGTRAAITRQLGRYVRSESVEEIILAATSRRILASVPDEILDMPITKHLLQGGFA